MTEFACSQCGENTIERDYTIGTILKVCQNDDCGSSGAVPFISQADWADILTHPRVTEEKYNKLLDAMRSRWG